MATFASTIDVALRGTPKYANPLLVGYGIEPNAASNTLMQSPSLNWREVSVAPSLVLQPEILRFPAGYPADVSEWEKGIGSLANRGVIPLDSDVSGSYTAYYGTDEHLAFCALHGSVWLYVANLYSRDADDLLAHLDYIYGRARARRFPVRLILQCGNEPYLSRNAPNYTAAQFAAVVSQFVAEVKGRYPRIEIAVPYRSTYDTTGTIWVSTSPIDKTGFSEELVERLSGYGTPVDYWTLHNGYLPEGWSDFSGDSTRMSAGFAGSLALSADIDTSRQVISQFYANPKFAITEFNGMHNQVDSDVSNSHASLLQELDYFRVMMDQNVSFATRHAFISGAVHLYSGSGGVRLRQAHWWGYAWLKQVMKGEWLDVSVPTTDTETIVANGSTPGRAGRIPSGTVSPLIRSFATLQGTYVHQIVLNYSQADDSTVTLNPPGTPKRQGNVRTLTSLDALNGYDDEANIVDTPATIAATAPIVFTAPPLSVSYFRYSLGMGTQ